MIFIILMHSFELASNQTKGGEDYLFIGLSAVVIFLEAFFFMKTIQTIKRVKDPGD